MSERRKHYSVTSTSLTDCGLETVTVRFFTVRAAVCAARALSADDAEAIVKVWRGMSLLAQFTGGTGAAPWDCKHLLDIQPTENMTTIEASQ